MDISVQLTLAYSILALPLSLPFLSSPYLLKTWHLLWPLAGADFSFKCPLNEQLLGEIFPKHFTEVDSLSSILEAWLQKAEYFKRFLGDSIIKLLSITLGLYIFTHLGNIGHQKEDCFLWRKQSALRQQTMHSSMIQVFLNVCACVCVHVCACVHVVNWNTSIKIKFLKVAYHGNQEQNCENHGYM